MMQPWFQQAKLGIFIHWGLYAVDGVPESWAMSTGQMSCDTYMKQASGFTASKYDPKLWAELIRKSGAKYAVLTSKHHEGFALFDTKYTDLNAVKSTPAGRDLIAPYCEALRAEGVKVGLYFTNTDWADDDHMQVILDMTPAELAEMRHNAVAFREIWAEVARRESTLETVQVPAEKKAAWDRFMTRYKGEITELLTHYGTVDVLWFDVMLQRKGYSWDSAAVKEMITQLSPETIVNERLEGHGDYKCPEMYIPLAPVEGVWELCSTFNDSWGYQTCDMNYKTVGQLVRMLCECLTKGGNLLISIGPDAQGQIPQPTQEKMLALGEWVRAYEEAIYPTERGIAPEYFLGGSTLTQDKKTLYLFAYDCCGGKLMLNGLRNKIKRVTSLKSGRALTHRVIGGAGWLDIPGAVWIDVDAQDTDPVCTVLRVELDGELSLQPIHTTVQSLGEM